MKFYISQQTKEELEAKIVELECKNNLVGNAFEDYLDSNEIRANLSIYKQILSNSIVLPVEKDWELVENICLFDFDDIEKVNKTYPNGVIIQKD